MGRGWYATGLLKPLWQRYERPREPGEGRREALARAVGTSPSVLSQINTGNRRLGSSLGTRLSEELGVSLLELGAPEEAAVDEASQTLRDRLESLAGDLAETVRDLARLQERVAILEARPWPDGGRSTGQGGGS